MAWDALRGWPLNESMTVILFCHYYSLSQEGSKSTVIYQTVALKASSFSVLTADFVWMCWIWPQLLYCPSFCGNILCKYFILPRLSNVIAIVSHFFCNLIPFACRYCHLVSFSLFAIWTIKYAWIKLIMKSNKQTDRFNMLEYNHLSPILCAGRPHPFC